MKLTPHFTFDGQSEEALNFYSEALNGKIVTLIRFSDMENGCYGATEMKPEEGKRILNGCLQFGENSIYCCDQMPGQKPTQGNNVMMDITLADTAEIQRVFDALVDGYRLPPLMFTEDEAFSFLMAERLLSEQSDESTYLIYKSGMAKIRTALKTSERNALENFEENVGVLKHTDAITYKGSPHILSPLLQSIRNKKSVSMDYLAGYTKEKSSRPVEPVGLYFMNNQWYLLAGDQSTLIHQIRQTATYLRDLITTHISERFLYFIIRKFSTMLRTEADDGSKIHKANLRESQYELHQKIR